MRLSFAELYQLYIFVRKPRIFPACLPPGVTREMVDVEEDFEPQFTDAELSRLLTEGRAFARGDRVRLGLGPASWLEETPVTAPLEGVVPGSTWRVAEGTNRGNAVTNIAGIVGIGRKGVITETNGDVIFVELVVDTARR